MPVGLSRQRRVAYLLPFRPLAHSTDLSRMTTPKEEDPSGPPTRILRALAREPRFLMLLPGLFWGGNAIVARSVTDHVPPIGLAFWRWTVAAILILPLAWPHLRRDLPVMVRHWPTMLMLSALGVSTFNVFLYIAAYTTTAINIVMLQTAMPVIVVLATLLLYREMVTRLQAVGIAISLAGTLTLISHGDPAVFASRDFNRGGRWMLAAVVAYAVYTAVLRERPAVHGLSFVSATFAIGAALLLPFYIAEGLWSRPLPLTEVSVLAIGYVAVFASILSYLAYNRTVELVGANTAGLTAHLVPVFGTLLAWVFLGERLHAYHAAGIALIGLGVWLATRKQAG